jgi:hypothetical protein
MLKGVRDMKSAIELFLQRHEKPIPEFCDETGRVILRFALKSLDT